MGLACGWVSAAGPLTVDPLAHPPTPRCTRLPVEDSSGRGGGRAEVLAPRCWPSCAPHSPRTPHPVPPPCCPPRFLCRLWRAADGGHGAGLHTRHHTGDCTTQHTCVASRRVRMRMRQGLRPPKPCDDAHTRPHPTAPARPASAHTNNHQDEHAWPPATQAPLPSTCIATYRPLQRVG